MHLTVESFHSRLTSACEDNPLFTALRNLSRLDVRSLVAGFDDSTVWSPWDPTGTPPDVASQLVPEPV